PSPGKEAGLTVSTKHSSTTVFERSLSSGVTLVDFNAPWCSPCRRQKTIIKALARTYGAAARVRSLDIDEHREIALTLGIQSIPTIIIYKDGREIDRFIGLQSTATLDNALRAAIRQDASRPR
ncbi:MAG TPA: thioredoxin family protein, partial [Desulfosarcina sp.]|nr:thioredoxin family protein [Desulfosarcina sp.]